MDTLVDLDGHVIRSDSDGFYWTDEYGYRINVDESNVVPPMMCERCYRQGRLTPAKVVHHIEWLTPQNIDDPHVSLSYSNFMRVCQDCHAAIHAGDEESRVTFDANGNVVWKECQ